MLDVSINTTVVSNELVVTVQEEVTMAIYDIQGKLVYSQKLDIGEQQIDISNLRSQMYIVKFMDDLGRSQASKIIVR